MKISFQSLYYNMPVKELFLYAILKTYQDQQEDGDKPPRSGAFSPLYMLYMGQEFNVQGFLKNRVLRLDIPKVDII